MKHVARVMLLILAFSIVRESVETPCDDANDCCVCLCQAPGAMTPQAVRTKPQTVTTQHPIQHDFLFAERLYDKSVFHPPKASLV